MTSPLANDIRSLLPILAFLIPFGAFCVITQLLNNRIKNKGLRVLAGLPIETVTKPARAEDIPGFIGAIWDAHDEWEKLSKSDRLSSDADYAEWLGDAALDFLRTPAAHNCNWDGLGIAFWRSSLQKFGGHTDTCTDLNPDKCGCGWSTFRQQFLTEGNQNSATGASAGPAKEGA
jgi:hypothetical protein